MTSSNAQSLAALQSIAADNRDAVIDLTSKLMETDDSIDETQNQLARHIDTLTRVAQNEQLSQLSHWTQEISALVRNCAIEHRIELASLLLQVIEQVSSEDDISEAEITDELMALVEEFKESLDEYPDELMETENSAPYEEQSLEGDAFSELDELINLPPDMASCDIEEVNETVDCPINDESVEEPVSLDIVADADEMAFSELELLADEDDSNDLLTILQQELLSLGKEVAECVKDLQISQGEQFTLLKETYLGLLERVEETAVACELAGLEFVCRQIQCNVHLLESVDSNVAELLSAWPELLQRHFINPQDDDICIQIADFLEHPAWPQPLAYRQMRELLTGLADTAQATGLLQESKRNTEFTEADISLEISSDSNEQLISAFLAEAPTHAENLSVLIQQLGKVNGEELPNIIASAQRAAHTLKGSSHLLGIKGIANYAHQLEDIFEYLGAHNLVPNKNLSRCLAEAGDTIELMMDHLQGQGPAPSDSIALLEELANWALVADSGDEQALSAEVDPIPGSVGDVPEKMVSENVARNEAAPVDSPEPVAAEDTVRVSRALLDKIFNLVGETSIALGQMEEQLKRLGNSGREMISQDQLIQARRFELENAVSVKGLSMQQARADTIADFDSLEMDHYDEFYGVAHSFIEVVNDGRMAMRDLYKDVKTLQGIAVGQHRLNEELQDLVLATRLEPVKSLTNRLQRCVRQACRMTGKEAELEIVGEQLLMDGDMLKELADPLMHILRNAVDHGIEDVETRRQKSKADCGRIRLQFQQQGNHIVVNCSDDGKGLDYGAIRNKAIAKGFLKEQDPTDEQMLSRYILQTGFSTRDTVSQVSGRGVGMDVVHTAILGLKGTMDIGNSNLGGAQIRLNLPITLLTNHSLLVLSDEGRFAIPSNRLEQIIAPGMGSVEDLSGRLCYRFNGVIYPLMDLSELLRGVRLGRASLPLVDQKPILLARGESDIVAISVDKVLSSSELVMKSAGDYLTHVNSISGMSLLGDGKLVPVLNIPQLLLEMSSQVQKSSSGSNISTPKVKSTPKILVVDDSLSVRGALSQLLTDAGYHVVTAKDGVEALTVLANEQPNLILTDLEMPRMTGLELTRHIRNSESSSLPIIMITSRTMQKHREQAEKSGVTHYFTKPFAEDDLLDHIQMLLIEADS